MNELENMRNEAAIMRRMIEKICDQRISEKTRQCVRTYNAKITGAPDNTTKTCRVRLVGESREISVGYIASLYGRVSVGDPVIVMVLSDNFRNAFVWNKTDLDA